MMLILLPGLVLVVSWPTRREDDELEEPFRYLVLSVSLLLPGDRENRLQSIVDRHGLNLPYVSPSQKI